jgi:hypothetical protein
MKNLNSSDISSMVLNTVNPTALRGSVCLGTPVSTALIWGAAAVRSATSAFGAFNRTKNFSAIWGTCPFRSPLQQTWPGQHV